MKLLTKLLLGLALVLGISLGMTGCKQEPAGEDKADTPIDAVTNGAEDAGDGDTEAADDAEEAADDAEEAAPAAAE